MADARSLVDAINALVAFARESRQSRALTPDEINRLSELDATIGSACQGFGIAIPQLHERLDERTQLFGFTRLPCIYFMGGAMLPMASPNWVQAMRGLRQLAEEKARDDVAQTTHEQVVSANRLKLFPKGIPENSDIQDLVVRLDTEKGSGKSKNRIAREFTGEDRGHDPKARSLLAQIRRLKRDGRVNL